MLWSFCRKGEELTRLWIIAACPPPKFLSQIKTSSKRKRGCRQQRIVVIIYIAFSRKTSKDQAQRDPEIGAPILFSPWCVRIYTSMLIGFLEEILIRRIGNSFPRKNKSGLLRESLHFIRHVIGSCMSEMETTQDVANFFRATDETNIIMQRFAFVYNAVYQDFSLCTKCIDVCNK